jgi:hypothetical protein
LLRILVAKTKLRQLLSAIPPPPSSMNPVPALVLDMRSRDDD